MSFDGSAKTVHTKIYVADDRGLVVSAIVRILKWHGLNNIVTRTHAELDLYQQATVAPIFSEERPYQELADTMSRVAGYLGRIVCVATGPDGPLGKFMNCDLLKVMC